MASPHRWRDVRLATFAIVGVACAKPVDRTDPPRGCKRPAHDSPSFVQPANDGVALDALLDASGYGFSGNSDWKGLAAGNFCGGPERELVLLKNEHSVFSIMRGPVPYVVNAFDFEVGSSSADWKAVAAADFDRDGFDEIVAVRNVTSTGTADLVLIKLASDCGLAGAWTTNVGGANANWHDVAVGSFDETGPQIALLGDRGVFLVRSSGAALTDARAVALIPPASSSDRWRRLAAGDLATPVNEAPHDELVLAREVSDGTSGTVLAFRLVRGRFARVAESTFGNSGNSKWTGLAVGDLNGDGTASIAIQKDEHSAFAILTYQAGALVNVTSSDLDTDPDQAWRGLTSVDWLDGDNRAAELVAVRKATGKYRTDLFVYGNAFHRQARDSGILGQKAEWDQLRDQGTNVLLPITENVKSATGAHLTTISWALATTHDYPPGNYPPTDRPPDGDYIALVDFLELTKATCVDGQQLRVSVTVGPKWGCKIDDPAKPDQFSLPEDSPLTTKSPGCDPPCPWNELDEFAGDTGDVERCQDIIGWAKVFGKLAQQYPHLVSFGIDDFVDTFDKEAAGRTPRDQLYTEEEIAEMQSVARQRAPWLTFVPTAYYHTLRKAPPDFAKTVDTLLYYYRNEKVGPECIGDPCAWSHVDNVEKELDFAAALLPRGRKLQVGTYWASKDYGDHEESASNRYDFELVSRVRNHPAVGGVTAYSVVAPIVPTEGCTDANWLNDGNDYCTLERAFR